MKKIFLNALIIIGIIIVTFIITGVNINIQSGVWGMPKGLSSLTIFISFFLLSSSGLSLFKKRLGYWGIYAPILTAFLFLFLPKALNSTIFFTLKLIPFHLSAVLGLLVGYIFYTAGKKKYQSSAMISIFPVLMTLGVNDLWVHKIEYGTFTGEIDSNNIIPFEMTDKDGQIITHESLRGKVVLLDFWFISCGPCWIKFPKLQEIYDRYHSNPLVEIYAVNRPMQRDEPGQLYSSIEKREYSFPVLRGTQEIMDAFNVYVYPSVAIIDQTGKVVFMGEIEKAEEHIERLLESL